MRKKKIVVFSGAGISAESGIKTFRDSGGLWEEYRIEDVATFDAWERNRELVLDFYNQRRRQVMQAKPNKAHHLVADLQNHFDVQVITQNIDDLHERAGSKNVLHLHGEIMKGRSTARPDLIYPLKSWEIKAGDVCEVGSQIRPHIVWFGEAVPEMERATALSEEAEIFITIGTSLNVYPAANLIHVVHHHVPKYLIDPGEFNLDYIKNLKVIKATAVEGMKILMDTLKQTA
ncbi:MAG: Silent information regulator protein Sir2 [Bacteroidota bacterium]|jgi:NAD-dependent deacetylase|nr:Silent information regulator protein Sir2 [Bacteroidota bacterium]